MIHVPDSPALASLFPERFPLPMSPIDLSITPSRHLGRHETGIERIIAQACFRHEATLLLRRVAEENDPHRPTIVSVRQAAQRPRKVGFEVGRSLTTDSSQRVVFDPVSPIVPDVRVALLHGVIDTLRGATENARLIREEVEALAALSVRVEVPTVDQGAELLAEFNARLDAAAPRIDDAIAHDETLAALVSALLGPWEANRCLAFTLAPNDASAWTIGLFCKMSVGDVDGLDTYGLVDQPDDMPLRTADKRLEPALRTLLEGVGQMLGQSMTMTIGAATSLPGFERALAEETGPVTPKGQPS